MESLTFERIHELGAERHPASWVHANHRAVEAIWGSPFKPDDPEIKRMVSLVVLKVLDLLSLP